LTTEKNCSDKFTGAGEPVAMVTVFATAAEASHCIDAVCVIAATTVVYQTFVDIYTVKNRHEHSSIEIVLLRHLSDYCDKPVCPIVHQSAIAVYNQV